MLALFALFVLAAQACTLTPATMADDYCNIPVNLIPDGQPEVDGFVSLVIPTTGQVAGVAGVTQAGVFFQVTDGTNPYVGTSSLDFVSTGLIDDGSNPDYVGIAVANLPVGNYTLTVWTDNSNDPMTHDIFFGLRQPTPNLPSTPLGVSQAGTMGSTFPIEVAMDATYQLSARATGGSLTSVLNAFRITLEDVEPPTIDCGAEPATFALDASCMATLPPFCPTVVDNCFGITQSATNSATDDQFFMAATTFSQTYSATDLAGLTAECTRTVQIVDNIAPILDTATCGSVAMVTGETDPDACSSLQVLPTNGATASDNCGTVGFVYVIPASAGLPSASGEYDGAAPPAVALTAGTYQAQIFAVSDGVLSAESCLIDVDIVDNQAPEVCTPAHSVTLPCGGNAEAAWLANAGWPVVRDNCPVSAGTFSVVENGMDASCGATPVRAYRSVSYTDFSGVTIQLGNITFDTADSSCTCNFCRPIEEFDTMVDNVTGVISPRANDTFAECSGDINTCWCTNNGEQNFLNIGQAQNKRQGPLPILWQVTDGWSAPDSAHNSATVIVPGENLLTQTKRDHLNQVISLESTNLLTNSDISSISAEARSIKFWQRTQIERGNGLAFVYGRFQFVAGPSMVSKRGIILPSGVVSFDLPVPSQFMQQTGGCPSSLPYGSIGPYLFDGEGSCELTIASNFMPAMAEWVFQQLDTIQNGAGKRSEHADAFDRSVQAMKDMHAQPTALDILSGLSGNDAATIQELITTGEIGFKLGFALHVGGNATQAGQFTPVKRSPPAEEPVAPADLQYWVDSVRFCNNGRALAPEI